MAPPHQSDTTSFNDLEQALVDVDRRIEDATSQAELLELYREAQGTFDELKRVSNGWSLEKGSAEERLLETLARLDRRKIDLLRAAK